MEKFGMVSGTPDETPLQREKRLSGDLESTPQASEYSVKREARIKELRELVCGFEGELVTSNEVLGAQKPIPNNLVRDEFANSVIQLRSMTETNKIYESAKLAFGRELTPEEEETVYTTLDYVLKRLVHAEVRKSVTADPERSSQYYFNAMHTNMGEVLPGDQEIFVGHDLVHIVLALQQGLDNENSAIPTFMQDSRDFNTGKQAMLEEAFATLFSIGTGDKGKRYDYNIENPGQIYTEAIRIFSEKDTPLLRGIIKGEEPAFTNLEYGNKAIAAIQAFLEHYRNMSQSYDILISTALFSQAAAFAETLSSESFATLEENEKLKFIEDHLSMAEHNIEAILTGEVPPQADDKYKKTVAITRDTYAESVRRVRENPLKPVFVEILLETLKPLYEKAKVQAETTYKRLAGKGETLSA